MWLITVFANMFTMLANAHAERGRRTLKDDNLQRRGKYAVLTTPREALAEGIQEKKNAAVLRRTYICQPSTSLLLNLTTRKHVYSYACLAISTK